MRLLVLQRKQHANLHTPEFKLISRTIEHEFHLLLACCLKNVLDILDWRCKAQPQLPRTEIADDCRQRTHVIGVRMTVGHDIETANPS